MQDLSLVCVSYLFKRKASFILAFLYNNSFTPLFLGSKLPPIYPPEAKQLGGRSTARKCPIGEG